MIYNHPVQTRAEDWTEGACVCAVWEAHCAYNDTGEGIFHSGTAQKKTEMLFAVSDQVDFRVKEIARKE